MTCLACCCGLTDLYLCVIVWLGLSEINCLPFFFLEQVDAFLHVVSEKGLALVHLVELILI